MFGEQIKPLEPQDKSDRRIEEKEGVMRRDESTAEVLSRGEENQRCRGREGGRGEVELS